MISYLVVIFILIGLGYFIFKLFNDLLSPSFVYCCSMIVCVLCSIIGLVFWNNINQLNLKTILIIILSVISFFLGELIVKKIIFKQYKSSSLKLNKISDIKWWKIIIMVVFMLATIVFMFLEIKRIAVGAGFEGGSIGEMIGKYRDVSTLFSTELIEKGENINGIVSQMRKICEVMAFVSIFYLVNNLTNKKIKSKYNIFYLVMIILAVILAILTAGRMQILIYIVSAVFMFSIIKLRNLSVAAFLKIILKLLLFW